MKLSHRPIVIPMTSTIRITAPYFCAGVDLRGGVVAHAAPILYYMKGWNADRVTAYCKRKGWEWEYLE